MKFSNPNQFERMRRLEGLKNPEDIWDIETFDDIKQTIEQLSPNTKELVSEEELTVEMKRCLEKTRTFCGELTEDFKQTFLSLLDQYRKERRQISQKIVDYLLEKNFVLPNFTIASREQAEALLEEYGLGGNINEKNLLLVFQLPKPLANFWWKGGANSWGDLALDIKDTAIEWGHFYRELMPVVWETQGRHENESGLDFQRVNGVGEHDPKKYYYIWEMSEREN
jgi:hypothetical protein